ncbi:MAG TPA: APC family permease [Bacteroidia bacterium]|nr:APC family permease [Bacteroidia bacterium]
MKKQVLGYFDVSMIVVSLVIGMGIFKTPGNVAREALTPDVFYLAWIFGGITALCGALTFAEIGSRLPVSGGYYRIFSHSYHPAFAFMLNGTILLSNAASVAGVALIGAEYISALVFHGTYSPAETETHRLVISAIEIILFFGLNMLGLKTSATAQNILTVFKLVVVAVLCCSVFVPAATTVALPPAGNLSSLDYLKSFGLCLIPISFTYGGYQQTINFGGEVENAPRTVPRAIITGMAIVIVLYLLINFVYVQVIGFDQLKSADSIASLLAERLFGASGGIALRFLLFFSVLAYVNVGLMSNPRVIMAMSEEKTLPALFSRHSRKFNVPVPALIAFTVATIAILFFAKTFDQLVKYVIFLDSLGFIGAAFTIFILRRKKTGEEKTIYRLKLYPFVPALFILAYGIITAAVISDNWRYAFIGLCIFFAFLPLYFIFTVTRKKEQ